MFETKDTRTQRRKPEPQEITGRNLKDHEAILLVAASEGDANMLYAAGFFVPDPFIFLNTKKPDTL